MPLQIGVTGYSLTSFNEATARKYIANGFTKIHTQHNAQTPVIVSGLTDYGIPALAYREADARNWSTRGIAPRQARLFPWYPVDSYTLRGDNWGDESEYFLREIDVLLRVGGGSQAVTEARLAATQNIPLYEYTLESK